MGFLRNFKKRWLLDSERSGGLPPRIVPPAMLAPKTASRASIRTRNPLFLPGRSAPQVPSISGTRRPLKIDSMTGNSANHTMPLPLNPSPRKSRFSGAKRTSTRWNRSAPRRRPARTITCRRPWRTTSSRQRSGSPGRERRHRARATRTWRIGLSREFPGPPCHWPARRAGGELTCVGNLNRREAMSARARIISGTFS